MERPLPAIVACTLVAVLAVGALSLGAHPAFGLLGIVAVGGLLTVTVMFVRRTDDEGQRSERHVARLESERDQAEAARERAEARLGWRMQLTAMRRSTEADALTDPETGLHSEGWFVVSLENRIAAARRRLTPVAVVMFEVVEGLAGGRPAPSSPTEVADALTTTIRESDSAFRLRDGGFAVLLDDTSDMGALWATERVRRSVRTTIPAASIWAGVACYPAHGLTADALLDRADQALDAARQWRHDRIEVAPAEV